MCGINGFNFKDLELIKKQNHITSHRGRDDEGFFTDEGISLGHNRLSIIDLSSAGHQPMMSEDGNLVMVYNGELYNYKELKRGLEVKGIIFKTKTDSEIVLKLYENEGHGCLKKFDGIFAIAIWDKKKQELFLARDQFGVKPLFYYFDGNKFIFSSEIKGILEHDIERQINEKALNTFFRLLYVNGPETILKNIFKLPPANFAILKDNNLNIQRYWEISDFSDKYTKAEAEEKIKSVLKKSVEKQMVADVPVGVFLSGGLDSTIVLGLATEQSEQKLKTFSVGFDVGEQFKERFNQDYNLAKKTAEHYGTEHYDVLIKEQDVIENFEKVVWHMDDLVYSPTQVANYILAEMASKEVKVVLGGDGGDELFGGYTRYYYYNLIDKWQSLPKQLRESAVFKGGAGLIGKGEVFNRINLENKDLLWSFMAQKENLLDKVLGKDFNSLDDAKEFFENDKFTEELFNNKNIDTAKKMMNVDLHTWLVDYSLVRSDKMSMAHSLEQRVPFLDKDLAELSMNIPTRLKTKSKEQGKAILKSAMRDYVPEFIYNKEKTGWFVPAAKWLRSGLKDYAYELLSEEYNGGMTNRYIDFKEARLVMDNHVSGKEYGLNTVWAIMTFQVWFRLFMNKVIK